MSGIELRNMNAQIGDFKLKDINLEVPKGTILGLIGKNGAGKTTLFKTINGTYLKTSGEMKIYGYGYKNNEKDIRNILAIVYDFFNANPYAKGKLLRKIYIQSHPSFDEKNFDILATQFKLDLNKRISSLSLGMQKKLMMIFALSTNPKVLLLDEPLIGVDPIDKQVLVRLIQSYMEDDENTIILSSHHVEDIEKIADYIAFIDDGKIILFEDKESLLEKYLYVKVEDDNQNSKYLINPIKNSFGKEGIMKIEDAEKLNINSQRASLEQIFVHLCS